MSKTYGLNTVDWSFLVIKKDSTYKITEITYGYQ